jgi:hypothetical protein
MAINTVVTWAPVHGPSSEVQHLIDNELIRLKTTGVTINSPDKSGGVTTRVWGTREAAQGWIDFLNSLEDAPESAVIVEE